MKSTSQAWREVMIGSLGSIVTGRTPPTSIPEYFGDKYPFITPGDMHHGKRVIKTARSLSTKGADLLGRIKVPTKSICVSCIGWQMGEVVMTSADSFTNQQLNTIVPSEGIDPDFVYYSLCPRKHELLSLGSGVGVRTPILNKSAFSNLTIRLPDLSTQRKIAGILSAYDDLIENNLRRIKILEEMAQSLYREWFVHFRFPGHETSTFVDSPLGQIPQGWSVQPVETVLKRLKAGTVYKKNDVSDVGAVPVIDQSTDLVLGFHGNEPDHCATVTGPIAIFGDHTCKIQLMTEPFSIGPNVIPFIAAGDLSLYYVYFLIRNLASTQEYKRHWIQLNSNEVVVAPSEIVQRFHTFVHPIFEGFQRLQKQNQNLRRTRDLLLPKLLSGNL